MNRERRIILCQSINELTAISDKLTELMDQEQAYLNNVPENLQAGPKGESAQEAIYKIEEVLEAIAQAVSEIEEVTVA